MSIVGTPFYLFIWVGLALAVIVAVAIGLTANRAMHWAKVTTALMFCLESRKCR